MTDTTPAPAATPEAQAAEGQQTGQEQPKTALTPEAQAAELAPGSYTPLTLPTIRLV